MDELILIGKMALAALGVLAFALTAAGVFTWAERKVAGRIQSRIGPNRQGPGGFLVWIADGVKLLLKEDLIPNDADRALFRLSPHLVFLGLILVFVVLPFGPEIVVADLNVGLFFIMAVTGLEVVGLLLAGWSSNSKWSLLGGMRNAAQLVSYEIPLALAFMVVALSAGTLSLQGIIGQQGGLPWEWFVARSPMHLVAFVIYYVSALAEGNRTPFDLPEAESELVSGFNTEYSGFRFAVFFMAEYANVWVINALAVALFFGGWQLPGVAPGAYTVGLSILAVAWFALKTLIGVFVVLWIRWTLPRVRLDQMMELCWKYLVPAGMVSLLLAALWEIAIASMPLLGWLMALAMAAGLIALVAAFLIRTWKNVGEVGDKVSLENW